MSEIVCEHGTLRRQCVVCELQERVADLEAQHETDRERLRAEGVNVAELMGELTRLCSICDEQSREIARQGERLFAWESVVLGPGELQALRTDNSRLARRVIELQEEAAQLRAELAASTRGVEP
jgi:hypothetical protein